MSAAPPPAPSLFAMPRRLWLLLDVAAAAGYGLLAFVVLGNGSRTGTEWLGAVLGAGCLAAPIAGRRRSAAGALVLLLVTAVALAVVAPDGLVMALPPLTLVLYTVAADCAFAPALAGLLGAGAVVVASTFPSPTRPGGILVALPVFTASWALGLAFGLHRRHLRTQLELSEGLRAAQVQRAAWELTEQRVRIARELHDVVAHGVSVITVQAGYAGLLVEDRSEVRAALQAIESTGRQTLGEMRSLLGVLRDDAADLAPAPTLEDLDDLVARTRDAGVEVSLARHGSDVGLPAAVELHAFRIVQEALTNVVKHAPHAAARIEIELAADVLTVSVRDDGPGAPPGPPGHGITGMSERAGILGGTLVAGPRPDRGFEVTARLPLGRSAAGLSVAPA